MDTVKIIWIIILCSFFSCKKEEDRLHKIIELEAFHTLQLNDSFEVELIEQDEFELEIIGDESFVKETKYNIEDSTLNIRNDKKLKWTDPANNIVKLIVKGKGLKLVHANESCEIKSLNAITTREFGIVLKSKSNTADIWLNNDVVFYWNNFPCGGKLTLRGTTNEVKIWNYAIMTVDASALMANTGLVENYSQGDCLLNISDQLEYKIGGDGNIVLWGEAEVEEQSSTGKGVLLRR